MNHKNKGDKEKILFEDFQRQVLEDYTNVVISRECSLLGRKEVLSGKGNFGIFGDGKELPQVVVNRFFQNGDFRAGYYRDQTLLLAQNHLTPKQLFSAIYAHLDIEQEPMSGGRQMVGHFVTRSVSNSGEWLSLVDQKNHSSDISSNAGQMPRLVGLAQASKVYRHLKIKGSDRFSKNGNEIAWGTIGNASTSEGLFLEAINAAGVLQIPMVISVWDDDYGISVHNKDHTTKESISEVLQGFQRTEEKAGLEIITVKGWDYPSLNSTYEYASKVARDEHVPVLVHVTELTQPMGHSTSGSHERYKSKERLEWEKEFDCNSKMKEWILSNGIAGIDALEHIEKESKDNVRKNCISAWNAYQKPIVEEKSKFLKFIGNFTAQTNNDVHLQKINSDLKNIASPTFKDVVSAARKTKSRLTSLSSTTINTSAFTEWLDKLTSSLQHKISSRLYTVSKEDVINFKHTPPTYSENAPQVDGRIIIRDNFEQLLLKYDTLMIFGEDVGKIGDVNQGLEGLQEKFGDMRIADTGIREATIIGQGIGLALRGLRPIAEIQYLDYILYCIQTLSDDLATLSYRTCGKQIAPLIIRTRGHRLEGIWHSGSPMSGLVSFLRGLYILVPRNMTQAAGFYNTLMQIQQPALVIESLNGYRIKEKMPENLGVFTIPIGKIEVLQEGADITIVSYGSTLRIVQEASERLAQYNIKIELIDIQTLIPFDLESGISKSLAKTNRLLIVDEDVPGGASAYILQQLIEKQQIFSLLDSAPKLLAAKSHRPAYSVVGDYFSKPSADDIFEAAYDIMNEAKPNQFPKSEIKQQRF